MCSQSGNALYNIESENFILCNPRKKSIQHFNIDFTFPNKVFDKALLNFIATQCCCSLCLRVHSKHNFSSGDQGIRDI